MILLLDTSTPECRLTVIDGESSVTAAWEAGRELSKHLLSYIHGSLIDAGKSWEDLTGLGIYKGPGSFTGLRIGITVFNTLSESLSIPIVGETGDVWQETAVTRLKKGENDRIVMPEYGAEAHITAPRK